jgi:hypothetical protein
LLSRAPRSSIAAATRIKSAPVHPSLVEKLFFSSRCSIRIDVFAIPADTQPKLPLTQWLGGQHGEEAKDEGSEEGDEEEDPQEEVVRCYFTIFDLALMSMIASNGPAAPDRR